MLLDKQPYTFDRVFRLGILAALVWALVWVLGRLSDVLIPFAVAVLLAYLMNPLVQLVQKKIRRRGPAVLVSLFLMIVVVAAVASFLVPLVLHQVVEMGGILTDVVNNSEVAARAADHLPPNLWEAITKVVSRQDIQRFFTTKDFLAIAQGVARRVLPGVWGVITGTASVVFTLVGLAVIGLYLVFLLLDYKTVTDRWQALLPPEYRRPVAEFVYDFEVTMHRYFRGQALVAFIVGVIYALGFWIVGLPLGILLGLFIGLLNMVPYLQVIGLIPAYLIAVIHALDTGTNLWLSLGLVTIVVVVSEAVQSAVLVPRIMGKATGLRPVAILLSLSIWGKLLGFFGLLIALPMTCLLFTYYQRAVSPSRSPEE